MRVSLLLTLLCFLSLVAVSVSGLPDEATHVDAMEQHQLEHDIQQPDVPSRTPETTPTRHFSRTDLMFPRRIDLIYFRRDPTRLRMERATDMDMGMGMGMFRLSPFERRMLLRMFRRMLRLRMREMFGIPMSRSEMRVIRMMALRDMMMAMDVQAEDATELAQIVDQREAAMDTSAEAETSDDTSETETESEHETEAIPQDILVEHDIDDPRLIDPTLMETDFETSQFGYGGYGGYGKKGGYGFGGKKGFPGINLNFNFGKKAPFKKLPPKKFGGFI